MWKGIDVSDNQGVIDWGKVAAAGVQFAILRSVRRSGKTDYQFAANLEGCRQHGIPVAVYKYTYATTAEQVKEEARQVVELLRSHGLAGTMVWWDVEDQETLRPLGSGKLTELIRIAQAEIEAAGYRPSVGRAIWGWQWTSNGRLPGIDGPVDFDTCYQDPAEWAAPKREAGVIYTVSVADVWTRAQAEAVQKELAAVGICGVVHKVQILE